MRSHNDPGRERDGPGPNEGISMRYPFLAFLALLISAAVTIVLVVAAYGDVSRYAEHYESVVPGSELQVVNGRGESVDGILWLRAAPFSGNPAALAATPAVRQDAGAVARIRVDMAAAEHAERSFLVWTRSDSPRQVRRHRLQPVDGTALLRMDTVEGWQGVVTRVGILVQGLDARVGVNELAFQPAPPGSWRDRLAAAWSEWRMAEGWSAHAINYIAGGRPDGLVSATTATALWLLLALALYALLVRLSPRAHAGLAPRVGLAVVVLVPWVSLDARWAWDLARQNLDTVQSFAGVAVADRSQGPRDREVMAFAREVRSILPADARVVLSSRRGVSSDRYRARRLAYHLRPLNVLPVWNHRAIIREGNMTDVDYVIFLKPLGDALRPVGREGHLAWRGGRVPVPGEVVLETDVGYLVTLGPGATR